MDSVRLASGSISVVFGPIREGVGKTVGVVGTGNIVLVIDFYLVLLFVMLG
jgi:hypothetical protein